MPTKRELKLIAFSAVFLLFIAGCGGGEVATGAPTTPFLGGSGGLEISFLEGSPPEEVTDGGTFPFNAIVTLKNVGEQDIKKEDIELSLIGFLPSQFGIADADAIHLKDQTLVEDLSGRKRDADGNILEPVESFFTFPNKDDTTKTFNFNSQIAGNNLFVFRADACYKYQTRVKSDICILNNQIDPAADAICKPSEAKAVFSSGSPIKVSSFRQNVAGPNKLQMSFDIEHSGQGSIFGDNLVLAMTYIDGAVSKAAAATKDEAISKIDASVKLLAGDQYANNRTALEAAKTELQKDILDFSAAINTLKVVKNGITSLMVNCPKDSTNRRAKEDQIVVSIDTGLSPIADTDAKKNYKLSCVGLSDNPGATTAKQSGIIKLINGKRTITCTLDMPTSKTEFVKPIEIAVDFDYAQNADKEVLVKHILTNP